MKRSIDDKTLYYPLTHAQKRIYYDEIKYPGQPWANMGYIVKYREEIDFNILIRAMNKVVLKNDALRLRLVEFDFDPEPLQYISLYRAFTPDFFDLSGPDSDRRLSELVERVSQKPFDLIDCDLFYFTCIKFNESEWGYFLKIHHIISDGWSIALLFAEITELYEALKTGENVDSTSYPSYIQYIEDEQEYLLSEQSKKNREFWHKTLFPLPEPVNLSSKKRSPSNIRTNRVIIPLTSDLRMKMHEFCDMQRTSLFRLVLSVFSIYVYRITGFDDILVGSVNHNRTQDDYKRMLGMFVSTFLLRIKIDENISFNRFLENNGEEINIILKNHQRYPFDLLVTELKELSRREVGNLRNISIIGHGNFKEEKFKYEYVWSGFEPEDLLVHINISNKDKDGILELEWIYQVELFSESEIRRIHKGLCNVLNDIFSNPNKKISDIELMSIDEKQKILYEFNNTVAEFTWDKTIHSMFEDQVQRTPGKTAVVFQDQLLTFQGLNERAGLLACVLQRNGITPGSIVPIIIERSLEMMVGIFAILKAGGAYLPIDPHNPSNRVNYLLKDSNSKLVLTSEKHRSCVDKKWNIIDLDSGLSYEPGIHPLTKMNCAGNTAYIIYTSGSTGLPKGVMIEHRSVINRLNWMQKCYPLDGNSVILQKTTYTFDVSVWELFWWSFIGASQCLLIPGGEKSPESIVEAIIKYNVSTMHFVPSMLNIFLGYIEGTDDLKKSSCLKHVFASGEALTPLQVEKFNELVNSTTNAIIINLYGPTEATVDVSFFDCPTDKRLEVVPIGKPIDNIKLLVIDKRIGLQPIGVPGELVISGVGLARGYLNRPELTLEKFVENPLARKEDWEPSYSKLYRTGDLARWLPDGNIECLGRIDHQVKIRGFRIETGEIESRILSQEVVKINDAVVVAREDTSGEKYLCAYLVADEKIDVPVLEKVLSKDLSDYMIPSYFVQIDAIPLTPSGKVDRKLLPDPHIKARGENYSPPQNPIEEKLVETWGDILSIDKSTIGIDDNFFKLGGHSLKAAALIASVHKKMEVKIPLHEVFNLSTPRKMAAYIKSAQRQAFFSIQPAQPKDFYPLSPSQKRLYILNLMETNSITYNIPMAYTLDCEPDRNRLKQAVNKLVNRHDSLRTSFFMHEHEPVQEIHEKVDFEIEYHKAIPFKMNDQTGEEPFITPSIDQLIKNFIRPFDLSRAPLFRFGCIKIDHNRYMLIADMHHIISDGISIEIFKRDLWRFYHSKEKDKDLAPLRIRYIDFVEWQLRLQEDRTELVQHQEEYWLGVFKGDIPVLNLPYDFPRPLVQSYEGSTIVFDIPGDEVKELKRHSTLFMGLFSVCAILMEKLSGQEDMVIGTTIAGREHPDLKDIIGMFVNTLPLRVYPARKKRFIEFLKEQEKSILEAFENQDYPFERLVETLDIERDVSRNPLFDVMFTLQVLDASKGDEQSLKLKPYRCRRTVSRFDMTFFAEETDAGLSIEVEYCTKLFEDKTIERFLSYFKNITRSFIENPGVCISDIEVMPEEEKKIVLLDFNDTDVEYPRDKTICDMFEEQVERTPDRTAIVFLDQQLTYRELKERAACVAVLLREKGLTPDGIVCLIVERSLEMMIGIFGISMAGGAYLPIEPSFPKNRIEYLIEDSSTRWLLTLEKFRGWVDFKYDMMDLNDPSLYRVNEEKNILGASSTNIAYIIYTSGSTGMPKGVMIEHHSVINRLNWMQKCYPLGEKDVILQKTTYVFDVSVWELFWWSFYGASQCLLIPGGEKNPESIIESILKYNISTMHFVPSMLNVFLSYLEGNPVLKAQSNLRQVFASGEALNPKQVSDFNELVGRRVNAVLINLYGPTEATVDVSYFNCPADRELDKVPIGKPIDNIKLLVVDKKMSVQPIGVTGELCIGGVGLARGYLNRPELTAEKFTGGSFVKPPPDPAKLLFNNDSSFIDHSSSLLYKTGDLARWLPDGNIEYLGRIDHQVKIRGFRIETGEIENKIVSQGGQPVKEAVVIVRDDKSGEKFLCAYIVSDKKIDITALTAKLSTFLPEYMIPSYFLQVERIPLTTSGKVDRKALPDPKIKARGEGYEAPRTDTERTLVSTWSKLLNVKEDIIGIDDNFFRLGGHSLKAAVLITMIHKELDVKLSYHDVFNMPTIRKLAAFIKDARIVVYSSMESTEEKEYYLLTSAQKRLFFMEQLEKNSILYNLQVFDLYLKGIRREELEIAFQRLIERHESLRTSFHTLDGEPIQRVHLFPDIQANFELQYFETTEDIKIFSTSFKEGEELGPEVGGSVQEVMQNFVKPFDLTRPPLLRAGLIKIGDMQKVLLLDMHHIVSDGTSLVVLIKDLWALYDEEELPPLKIQYKDFTEWFNGEHRRDAAAHEKYWLKVYREEVQPLNLPYDYPRPAKLSFAGNMVHFEIGVKETHKLALILREQGVTLYMILMAAYYVMLSKLSGQEDIVVGTVTAGRDHADIQNIIGMFVDTLAMRGYPTGTKTFKAFLKEVKDMTLAGFENQSYPFEELVSRIAPRQELSRNPLFDVLFGLENEAESSKEYLIEVLMLDKTNPYKPGRSKFDMTLLGAEKVDGLQFNLEYNTSLFNTHTIERFIEYYRKIICAVCTDISQEISHIEMISDEEKVIILYMFNDTDVEYPADKTIHELVEERADKLPGHIAVSGPIGEKPLQVTYRELNERAEKLGHVLRKKGVGRESIVALMVDRCVEMITGQLAVLKAGGAYLSLDMQHPEPRRKFMLDDSSARVLLVEKKFMEENREFLDVFFDGHVIPIDDEGIYAANKDKDKDKKFFQFWKKKKTGPDDLAYVIYTSGSTGKPKGVMVRHRGIPSLMEFFKNRFHMNETDRVVQFANPSFDASVWEIYVALLNGAVLCLTSGNIIRGYDKFLHFMNDACITVALLPPVYATHFENVEMKSLRLLVTGGSAANREMVERWRKKLQYVNAYGPTESTVISTMWIANKRGPAVDIIPIGPPIGNIKVFIVDKYFKLIPVGVGGELCIGGFHLARGYLNRPELTLEKFVKNPFPMHFTPHPTHLYRTGDLTRWHTDGNIEFLGRIDFQVKIRGFRIEIGEIETQLSGYPDIKDAIVTARDDHYGEKYLCAYFVAHKPIEIGLLRKSLSNGLPAYMVPSHFIQMETMPLTTSGKIDRKALPEPGTTEENDDYTAPYSETEKILCDTWSEVLGVKKISIDANFFEMGGDSIKTLIITAKLLKRGLRIDIDDFFSKPSIRRLAAYVKKVQRQVSQEEVHGIVPLTPINTWYFQKSFIQKHHFHHVVTLFKKEGYPPEIIDKVFRKMVEHHDALRMVYETHGDTVTQRIREIKEGKLYDLEIMDLTFSNDLQAHMDLHMHRICKSVDLRTGPLVKVGLFITKDGDYLMMAIHHTVVDGISWRVLLEDFDIAYDRVSNSKPIVFQDKTDSFKDWAVKLKEYADSPAALTELEYWKTIEEKDMEKKIKPLPVDRPTRDEDKKLANFKHIEMKLDTENTRKLLKDVNFPYNTEINDILLTALAAAVNRWTRNDTLLINLEGHGREGIIEDIDISRTVGWFTSQYPLLLEMDSEGPGSLSNPEPFEPGPGSGVGEKEYWPHRIRRVKETLRKVPNKGIGYGILRFLTSPCNKEGVVFSCQPQIGFNYLGQMGKTLIQGSTSPEFNMDLSIDINGSAGEDGLILYFGYNTAQYDASTVSRLADYYKESLVSIIDHCFNKKEEIVNRGIGAIDYHVESEEKKYLEQVEKEIWPDLPGKKECRNILLTGAAGFLGSHLLKELLENTPAVLYLPVRGASNEEAAQRVRKKLSFYFNPDFYDRYSHRLAAVKSDLSAERLGLDPKTYEKLSSLVDTVVHPAANVKHHAPYEELYKDNVRSTENLLKFALAGEPKDFHHVSTLSVGHGDIPGKEYMVFTEYAHDIGQRSTHVYLRSKFEAEQKVLEYRQKGVNASIYRVGNLIFQSQTGVFQENIQDDYFYAIIKGIVKLGFVTESLRKIVFDMSYIDYTAKGIALLAMRKELKNETYHLVNPTPVPLPEIEQYLKELGFDLKYVEDKDAAEFFSRFEGNPEFEKIIQRLKFHTALFEEESMTRGVYKVDRTRRLLEKLGFTWPRVSKEHIERMMAYCKEVEFI